MTRRKRLDFVSRACIGMFLLLFGEILADTVKDQALPGKNFDQPSLPSNETYPPKTVFDNNGTNLPSPTFEAFVQNSSLSSTLRATEGQNGDGSNRDVEEESRAKSHVPGNGTDFNQENVPTSITSSGMQDESSAGRSDHSASDKLSPEPTSDSMADRVRLEDDLKENVDKSTSPKAAPKEVVKSSTTKDVDTIATSTQSTLTTKLESKRGGSVKLPEVQIEDREDDDRREATTQVGDRREDEENSGTESGDETQGSESFNLENTGKSKSVGVSLANDTRVNYGRKDQSGRKEDSEDPKGEVEVIKSVSQPTLRKLVVKKEEPDSSAKTREQTNGTLENELDDKVGAEAGVKEKFAYGSSGNASEDSGKDSSGSAKIEDLPRRKQTAPPKAEDDVNDGRGTVLTTTSSPSPVPRGRTIAFSGVNEFPSTEEKSPASGSTREAGSGHDYRDKGSEVPAKKNASGEKMDQKPYPYVKSTKMTQVEESFVPGRTDKVTESTSEESSAYENTISRRQESETKFVVTEPSVVIENSIQQFKTTDEKRSGNATDAQFTKSQVPVTVTLTSLESSDRDVGANSTLGDEEKVAGLSADSSRTTSDDVPHRTDVIDERKEITGKDENFDVTGNGITEISPKSDGPSYGSSFRNDELTSNTTTTVTSESKNVTRTTERTEMSTNVDVQTDAEESLLLRSTLNVTETSTEYPLMKSNLTEDVGLTATTNEPSTSPASIASSNDTEFQTLATTSPTITTTPMTSLTPDRTNNDTARISDSTWSLNESSIPTTTATIEYEFVGLTDVTEAADENVTTDKSATRLEEQTENFTTSVPTTLSLDETTTANSVHDTHVTSIANSTMIPILSTDEMKTVNDDSTTPKTEFENGTASSPGTRLFSVNINSTLGNVGFGVHLPTLPTISASIGVSVNVPETTTMSEAAQTTTSSSSAFVPTTLHPRVVPNAPTSSDAPVIVTTERTTETTQILPPDDIPLLVRIVIVGTLPEVCPHLPKLRQVLAEMLNNELSSPISEKQIIFHQNPCTESQNPAPTTADMSFTSILVYVVDEDGKFDVATTKMLPNLNQVAGTDMPLTISSIRLVQDTPDSGNAIAVVIVCSVAFICLVLLAGLLFIMRKRQTRFNYGERCRPVSLDAYSLDSVSAYNSVRRKGVARSSKRSYGNPTFEDSSAIPSHPLNFAGLSSFHTDVNAINEEFSGIPQVWAKIDELPAGAEVKNRYANVIPLPETRVPLQRVNNDPLSEYINASYVRGPKNATKYYIACQAPMDTTVTDFWRMIWEQQSKVIIMLTDLVENGIEKCTEYIPPSEVTDCHRLYGDFQVTLKKRETKEKYAISTLHLKNLENNTFREVYHIWYLWPVNGVQSDGTGLIAILLEARALQRGGPGPIVVHCSPGTGRTGTLIALDLGIRQYEITRTVDVPRVVYTIRRDRAGSVQTKEQYGFIYKALNLYATKLAGGVLESS